MRQSDKYINRQNILNDPISTRLCIIQWGSLFFKVFTAIWCTARLMTIVPWIPNLAKLLCTTRALTFYFHCTIFQLNAQIAHGAGLSRSLDTYRNTYQISQYVSFVEKVYRYTPIYWVGFF